MANAPNGFWRSGRNNPTACTPVRRRLPAGYLQSCSAAVQALAEILQGQGFMVMSGRRATQDKM
jgi:hypothetical protein